MGRIRYGFSNLYYALATDDGNGTLTYATPVKIPGAKGMTMTPAGTDVSEPADNTTWFSTSTNDGYTGSIEFEDTEEADAFLVAVLGMTKDATSGLTVEKSSDDHREFAILGQMQLAGGTETGKRACFYRCTASRPEIAAQTKEVGGLTVAINTVNITALPRISDDAVKSTAVSTDSAYSSFFTAVPEN